MTWRAILVAMISVGSMTNAAVGAEKADEAAENRWEKTIQKFEAQDRKHPPEKGGILFVGSSSIVGWNVKKCFPGLPALNRGFGGSTIADVNYFIERVVAPYAPKTIVFYSGDNDIAGGKSVEEVYADFETFVSWVHRELPETRILLMPIKPSIARWGLFEQMAAVNERMRALAVKDERLVYIDGAAPLLGEDRTPRKDLLRDDGLHLNEAGYAVWTAQLKPLLETPEK